MLFFSFRVVPASCRIVGAPRAGKDFQEGNDAGAIGFTAAAGPV
jgi:hypothetical protein